jgi:hypothetical protein
VNTEPCARPGYCARCGHSVRRHHAHGCRFLEQRSNAVRVCCSCPACRTQAQQEAWEALRREVGEWYPRTSGPVQRFMDAAQCLLELYP